MEYFLSHLPYIIVAGVCIAAIAVIWAIVSNAAADSKDADASETASVSCEGCMLSGMCSLSDSARCTEEQKQKIKEHDA
jgi:hypothetical protein